MVENNLIKLQIEREITALFKDYLEILDNLNLDEKKHIELRKHILNKSNDSIRNMIQFLGYFDFQISPERVSEAVQQKVVFKKTIFSPPVIV